MLMSAQVFAHDSAAEDISSALDDMVKNNIISSTEARRARIRLKSAQKSFLGSTNRMPASAELQLIDTPQTKDLSKVQMKQIEKEIDFIFRKAVDK